MGVKGLKNSRCDSKVDQLEHLPTSKIHFGCEHRQLNKYRLLIRLLGWLCLLE